MKCSVCGSDNLEGSAYCEDCGAKLAIGAGAVAGRPGPPQAPAAPSSGINAPRHAEPHGPAAHGGGHGAPPPAPPPPVQRPASPAGPMVTCACGAANPAQEQYCHDCGANLRTSAQPGAAPVAVAAVAKGPARLRLLVSGQEYILQDLTQLGRRSPADGIEPEIDLTPIDPDSYASRRHGRITRQGDQFVMEDVGSANGTFLNGTRVEKGVQHPLREGDKVRFGKTEFVFTTQ